jgi:hypothetical protein
VNSVSYALLASTLIGRLYILVYQPGWASALSTPGE